MNLQKNKLGFFVGNNFCIYKKECNSRSVIILERETTKAEKVLSIKVYNKKYRKGLSRFVTRNAMMLGSNKVSCFSLRQDIVRCVYAISGFCKNDLLGCYKRRKYKLKKENKPLIATIDITKTHTINTPNFLYWTENDDLYDT